MWLCNWALGLAYPTIRQHSPRRNAAPSLPYALVRDFAFGASMIRCLGRLPALSIVLLALAGVRTADAQYFGRNKVQYERFDWRILSSDHFDLYYYPSESLRVNDAGREEERW